MSSLPLSHKTLEPYSVPHSASLCNTFIEPGASEAPALASTCQASWTSPESAGECEWVSGSFGLVIKAYWTEVEVLGVRTCQLLIGLGNKAT